MPELQTNNNNSCDDPTYGPKPIIPIPNMVHILSHVIVDHLKPSVRCVSLQPIVSQEAVPAGLDVYYTRTAFVRKLHFEC